MGRDKERNAEVRMRNRADTAAKKRRTGAEKEYEEIKVCSF